MSWIVTNMKWIMIVSGVLTSTMLYVAIAPAVVLFAGYLVGVRGKP